MTIIIWKCKKCESIQVSNSKIRHQMNFCKCRNIGLDLEEWFSRVSFAESPEDLIELKKIKDTKMDVWREILLFAKEQGFINDNVFTIKDLNRFNEIEK